MQMRASDTPGRANRPDFLTFCDHGAFRHIDFRKMGIERIHPMAVIQHDQAPKKMEIIGQAYPPGGGCNHGRAGWCGEIQPEMRLAGLAI